jgi:hypothetical protein
MIKLKKLLKEQSQPTYTTKKSWTLKTDFTEHPNTFDVVLNIPAGTTWKLLDPDRRGFTIQTETPLGYKFILQSDPTVFKYTEDKIKAAYYKGKMNWSREVRILIGVDDLDSKLPAGYARHGNYLSHVDQPIVFDSENNPQAEDLFYNLEQAFISVRRDQ